MTKMGLTIDFNKWSPIGLLLSPLFVIKSQQVKDETNNLIGAPTDKLYENIFGFNMPFFGNCYTFFLNNGFQHLFHPVGKICITDI